MRGGEGHTLVHIGEERTREQNQKKHGSRASGRSFGASPQRQVRRRAAVEPRDAAVRGDRRHARRDDHQGCAGPAIKLVAVDVELSDRIFFRRHQIDRERQRQHQQPAGPSEHKAPARQRRALVIIAGQAGHDRQRRNFVTGYRGAHQEGEQQQIAVEPARRGGGWVPQHHPRRRHRQDRGVHPRVALAPAAVRLVAPIADQRIDDRVEQQRDEQDEADDLGVEPEHLIVKEHQQRRETVVLDAIGDRAKAVAQLDPQRQFFGGGQQCRIGSAHASAPAFAASSIATSASNRPGASGSDAWRWPIVSPPSTSICVPVMNELSSLAR